MELNPIHDTSNEVYQSGRINNGQNGQFSFELFGELISTLPLLINDVA